MPFAFPPESAFAFAGILNEHGQANIGPLLGLSSFTGSVQITSSVPILTLLINFEAAPVFSSLPPADLPVGTALSGQAAK